MNSKYSDTLQKKCIKSISKQLKEYNNTLDKYNEILIWNENDTLEILNEKLIKVKNFNLVKYTNILKNAIQTLYFIFINPLIYEISSKSLYEWSKLSSKSLDFFNRIFHCLIGKTMKNFNNINYFKLKTKEYSYINEILLFLQNFDFNLSEYIRLYKSKNVRDPDILDSISNNIIKTYDNIHDNFEKLNNLFLTL